MPAFWSWSRLRSTGLTSALKSFEYSTTTQMAVMPFKVARAFPLSWGHDGSGRLTSRTLSEARIAPTGALERTGSMTTPSPQWGVVACRLTRDAISPGKGRQWTAWELYGHPNVLDRRKRSRRGREVLLPRDLDSCGWVEVLEEETTPQAHREPVALVLIATSPASPR